MSADAEKGCFFEMNPLVERSLSTCLTINLITKLQTSYAEIRRLQIGAETISAIEILTQIHINCVEKIIIF